LNVVHHRVHVDHFDRMPIPHHRGKWLEYAVDRLDARRFEFKLFPLLDPFDQHDDIFKRLLSTNVEHLQQPPASPI
jgi:hypothetical protein